ncbi:Protein of unknown function [Pyronema omphalodes CBS 100304]|nr:Protein of unknown function [Pyronema omphalodes CBS 100304]
MSQGNQEPRQQPNEVVRSFECTFLILQERLCWWKIVWLFHLSRRFYGLCFGFSSGFYTIHMRAGFV